MGQSALFSNQNVRIGLLPAGGKEWIAGAIYLHNIIRAVGCLPREEWPRFYWFIHYEHRYDHARELKGLCPKILYYSHRDRDTFRNKMWLMRHSLLAGKWPGNYDRLLRSVHPHVLFPAFDSLGKNYPVPWIGWIPDFQHKHLPQFFSGEELRKRDAQFQRIVDEAPRVVVSSEDALNDLKRWFPTDLTRVSILRYTLIPLPEWYEQDPQTVVRKYQLPAKFLMFPSQFWIHKNHKVLFEAIRILKAKGFDDIALVCTGHQHDYRVAGHFAELRAWMKDHHMDTNIHLPGLLPRDDQIQLLRAAAAIVQPSLFEGWSSLVEDCRTLGKRLYVSDLAIHREQVPPHATFFNPANAEQLAECIARDWNNLSPGPDTAQEERSRTETQARAVVFARTFLKIVDETSRSNNRGPAC